MMRAGQRTVAASTGGPVIAGVDVRSRRVAALLAGMLIAALATVALNGLGLSSAPRIRPAASAQLPRSHPLTGLPVGLAAAASASIGASDRAFWPVRRGAALLTTGGGIHATFTAAGTRLRAAQGTLGLSLAGVGRDRVEPLAAVAPERAMSEVLYRHDGVGEFFRNGPDGLEQGFTLPTRPQMGSGSLTLTLAVRGALIPEQDGSHIAFRTRTGATALEYGALSAVDAGGRRLPAHMQVRKGTLLLRVDDRHARYPLRIDPFFQQGPKLTGSGESGKGQFGESVALSADGNTALVGAPNDSANAGAAWVFTRSGSTWEQQGPKLTGGGESGNGHFGYSVALSGDASTALIGGSADGGEVGAAWVFTRSGSTWEQQGSKLTGSGESGKGRFGYSVALSSDASSALIGGLADNSEVGAAWAFTRSGSTWEQQGSKLTGSGESGKGHFGFSVALSADASSALIGGGADGGEVGAAWAFTRSGSIWEQQGPKLTGSGESGKGHFGVSVALSADASSALIGGLADSGEVGAAWAFTRSGSTWEQQGPKLTGGGESGKGRFGVSVALSADASTALIGGSADSSEVGAAWAFLSSPVAPPKVTSITPSSGSTAGGTPVTIKGSGFLSGATVTIGNAASSVNVLSETELTATTTATAAGADEVVVSDANGTSTGGPTYTYVAPTPPIVTSIAPTSGTSAGGTKVTIKGSGFLAGATVTIGNGATAVTVVSATTIKATTSATAAGADEVVVTDANGTSTGGPTYTYVGAPPPKVTSITPTAGPIAGGTNVTIKGTGFLSGATVTIGNAATAVTVVSATKITATTSATPAGGDEVVVSDANGTSTGGPTYTYVATPPPTVTSVAPTSGTSAGGTKVTIVGSGFLSGATVTIGNAATSVNVVSATKITAFTTATPAGGDEVVVSDANGTSTGGPTYTYVAPPPPTVTSVTPTSGPTAGGTTVTIKGTNLTSSAPVVDFGSTAAANITSATATKIVVVSPQAPSAGTVDVTVTTAGGTSAVNANDRFTYVAPPPPTVASITPTSGTTAGGTPVTIKGSGFLSGATVTIGNAASSVNVVSATELTATTSATPAGADEVVVSDANGTSTGGPTYTYVAPPPPTVTSVTPTSGTTAGGTPVTIKGSGFLSGATVTIGNVATSVNVVSATELTATTSATPAGGDEVVVSDANGTSTGGPSFTYLTPPPTVASITPTSGTTAGGTPVTITGSGFLLGATVTIGSEASEVFVVSETEITATTSATEAGADEVVVTDANGTSTGGPLYTYVL